MRYDRRCYGCDTEDLMDEDLKTDEFRQSVWFACGAVMGFGDYLFRPYVYRTCGNDEVKYEDGSFPDMIRRIFKEGKAEGLYEAEIRLKKFAARRRANADRIAQVKPDRADWMKATCGAIIMAAGELGTAASQLLASLRGVSLASVPPRRAESDSKPPQPGS